MARPPTAFNNFIGQRRVVAHLRKLVTGARERGEAMGSVLLLGPPGMGKTALAGALACEYGGAPIGTQPSNFVRILAGPRITSTIVEKLRAVKFADFVFVDEAHALDRESQELLNIAIDERRTLGCREDGKLDRGQSVSIAEFTLVAATTEPGKMTKALRSRLNEITLDPYGLGELKAIAEKAAKELKLTVTPQAAKHLAERSQRTPRSVEKLLKLLAVTKSGVAKVDQQLVRGFLEELGIDEHGLDRSQQSHLKILFAAGTRPTSLAILKARLGLDADYILSDIEPHLLFLELIDIGLRGRTLTERGRGVAHEIVRATEAVESCDESDSVSNEEAR